MVVDDDVLEKDDMYILDRMKDFISNEEVIRFAAAKQLMIFIERAVCPVVISFTELHLGFVLANGRRCYQDDGYGATISASTDPAEDLKETQTA